MFACLLVCIQCTIYPGERLSNVRLVKNLSRFQPSWLLPGLNLAFSSGRREREREGGIREGGRGRYLEGGGVDKSIQSLLSGAAVCAICAMECLLDMEHTEAVVA